MLNLSKRAIYVISLPGWEEVFLKFPTSGGGGGGVQRGAWRQPSGGGLASTAQWGWPAAAGAGQRLNVGGAVG